MKTLLTLAALLAAAATPAAAQVVVISDDVVTERITGGPAVIISDDVVTNPCPPDYGYEDGECIFPEEEDAEEPALDKRSIRAKVLRDKGKR